MSRLNELSKIVVSAVVLILMATFNTNAGTNPLAISPVLECTQTIESGEDCTAYWGYNNRNEYTVNIPIGNNNKFSQPSQDQGQPTAFEAGRQYCVFSTDFNCSNQVWTVNSGAGARTATASGDSVKECPSACIPCRFAEETVSINGCETDVDNSLIDGCSINDLIDACAYDARNHGAYVSCVADLTNMLKAEQVISGKEKGDIQSCAAQSDIGK